MLYKPHPDAPVVLLPHSLWPCLVPCMVQSAAVSVPHTKVPLTLTVHKLMATDRGVGGMLQLPIRVAGLPLTAAAKGESILPSEQVRA